MPFFGRLMKTSLFKILYSEAFSVGIGIAGSSLILIIGTRFLTSLLSTQEYGRLALSVSVATFATYVFANPIGQTATRFYLLSIREDQYSDFERFIKRCVCAAMCAIILFGLSAFFMGRNSPNLPGEWMVLLTMVFSCSLVVNRVAIGVEDAARERRVRALSQTLFELLRFGFAISLILLLGKAVAEVTLGGFVLAGILIILFHVNALHRLPHSVTPNARAAGIWDASQPMRFLKPLVLSNGGLWIVMMTERWILQRYANMDVVGGYTAVYQLSFVPMLFLSNFFIILAEPLIYQVLTSGTKTQKESKAFSVNFGIAASIVLFSFLVGMALFFLHSQVGEWVLGKDFRAYSWLFPWLVFAGGCFAASQQLLLKLNYEMRTKDLARIWIVISMTALAMYYTGAAWFHLEGLLAAVVCVHVLLLFLTFFIIRV